jgi:hypothetical protein
LPKRRHARINSGARPRNMEKTAMRKFVVVLGMSAALLLAGCDTTDSAAKVSAAIADVQAKARQYCAFVPTAATVAELLKTMVPGLTGTVGVAQAICNAVTNNPMAEGPGKRQRFGQVSGVVIEGHLVKPKKKTKR